MLTIKVKGQTGGNTLMVDSYIRRVPICTSATDFLQKGVGFWCKLYNTKATCGASNWRPTSFWRFKSMSARQIDAPRDVKHPLAKMFSPKQTHRNCTVVVCPNAYVEFIPSEKISPPKKRKRSTTTEQKHVYNGKSWGYAGIETSPKSQIRTNNYLFYVLLNSSVRKEEENSVSLASKKTSQARPSQNASTIHLLANRQA